MINSIRLDAVGLACAQLEALGSIANVVKIGALHGRDDAFYKMRYGATFWALPGMPHEHGVRSTRSSSSGGEDALCGAAARVRISATVKLPECILRIDRAGGILAVACDSLQNWLEPDEFFSEDSRRTMTEMGFFQAANLGPLWMQINEPRAEDFARLRELPFRHALCGHGAPLRENAARRPHTDQVSPRLSDI